jgi:hypothetical protein
MLRSLYGWSSVLSVEFVKPLSSQMAIAGDLLEVKLAEDFRFGPKLIAAKDSLVRGHIVDSESARTLTRSAISSERRLKSRGRLTLQFDEIIDQNGRRWPIQAKPSPRLKNQVALDKSSSRCIETDALGRIVKSEAVLTGGLKATATAAQIAGYAPVPGTFLFSTLAPAVAMGAVGAASPSVVYNKPIDDTTENRREKGAAYGFMTSLPGAFLVKSIIEKGNEIELLPGDKLTLNVCIKESGYQLPPGEKLSVNAQLMRSTPSRRLYPTGYNQQRHLNPAM